MSDSMMVQMYGTKKFPQEVRKSFQLPADPYDATPEYQELALKYLGDMGIVF